MERSPFRDFIVGLFVLAGLVALGYLSLSVGGATLHESGGMTLYALFDEIGGLKPRAPVEIGGVKIGQVVFTSLDKDFRVRVTMNIDPNLQLPDDTFASIFTEGLLGDRYVSLQPGGSDTLLKSGDTIYHTESAIVLERFIGKLMYGLTGGGNSGNSGGTKDDKTSNGDKTGQENKPAAPTTSTALAH